MNSRSAAASSSARRSDPETGGPGADDSPASTEAGGEATRVIDRFGRPLRSLRISLVDRCNLRCRYCMPEDDYVWLSPGDILDAGEIERVVAAFAGLGVDRVRLTGGEPLLRADADEVTARLAGVPGIRDLAMTTNGVLLRERAGALVDAGLRRVTVSLDTLRPDRFGAHGRRSLHARILDGIDAAAEAGLRPLKLNTVVVRGYNDGELADLVRFAREREAEIRFIEYMDVGGATRWSMDQVVSKEEILRRLGESFGGIEPASARRSAPADRFRLPDGTPFGVVASTTDPFCRTCDRSRVTADGVWFLCLYAEEGLDLKEALRNGVDDEELRRRIVRRWEARADRGAEERKRLGTRRPLYQIEDLREDPHREMHTRGG